MSLRQPFPAVASVPTAAPAPVASVSAAAARPRSVPGFLPHYEGQFRLSTWPVGSILYVTPQPTLHAKGRVGWAGSIRLAVKF